jgi:two-component system, chemotaxis family, protein-glutamate methylesterase/glutaminase
MDKHTRSNTKGFDLVVFASSAGGVRALMKIISELPADLPAAVMIVQHLHPDHKNYLPTILAWDVHMKVKQAEDGDQIQSGWVYIAPPDHHMKVAAQRKIQLSHEPQVNYVRPSADVLFKSAARNYGDRLIAVVLSGTGKDGREGVKMVKEMGGVTIAQEPDQEVYAGMPRQAISTGKIDHILKVFDIAGSIQSLIKTGECDDKEHHDSSI